jgi:hypothetical protein
MARRPKKSLDDQEKEALSILERVKRERKELEQAQRATRAFAVLDAIDKMIEAGDEDAKRVMAKFLDGLTVKRERLAFGLDPLPVPAPAPVPAAAPVAQPAPAAPPAARPAPSDRVKDLSDRLDRAVAAQKAGPTAETTAALAAVVVEFETITRKLFTGIASEHRAGFGLGKSPAERL